MNTIDLCPLCGARHLKRVGETSDYLVSKGRFGLEKCLSCGVVITNPQPGSDAIGGYYLSDKYISHQDVRKSLFERVYGQVKEFMLNRKISLVQRHLSFGGPWILLDFGCATGAFLVKAKQAGFWVKGVERDVFARDIAQAKGLEVVEDLSLVQNQEKIHVVTLWHVLEHVSNPEALLKEFHQKMVPNGLIIVAVPDHSSFDAKFYDMDWAAWDTPRHLFHFDAPALLGFFLRNGYVFERKYPLWFDSFYVSLLSERNKNTGVLGQFRGLMVGMISFLFALLGVKPWSSHTFVFRSTG